MVTNDFPCVLTQSGFASIRGRAVAAKKARLDQRLLLDLALHLAPRLNCQVDEDDEHRICMIVRCDSPSRWIVMRVCSDVCQQELIIRAAEYDNRVNGDGGFCYPEIDHRAKYLVEHAFESWETAAVVARIPYGTTSLRNASESYIEAISRVLCDMGACSLDSCRADAAIGAKRAREMDGDDPLAPERVAPDHGKPQ